MMYIGVRSCECLPEEDNYWGTSHYLPNGRRGNLAKICDKFILGVFETREEAMADEIKRHESNDVARSEYFWNKAKALTTGFTRDGSKLSEEHKQKIGDANRGKQTRAGFTLSESHKRKIGKANKGNVFSEEHRNKLAKAKLGVRHSEEHKRKIGDAQRGLKRPLKECPHCFKVGGAGNMKRYHFDNCKLKGGI